MAEKSEQAIREIVDSIRKVVRAIYLDSRNTGERKGLTGPQSLVIHVLSSKGPLSSAGLSRILAVTPANITGIVDRLETKGLVERIDKPGDRRVHLVKLTENGEKIGLTLQDPIEERLIRGLADLDPSEVSGIREAISRVAGLIEALKTPILPAKMQQVPMNEKEKKASGAKQ